MIYVAGGWFDDRQLSSLKEIENLALELDSNSFCPRLHNLGSTDCDWDSIFQTNIDKLNKSKLVIASTVNKDMGTIWECGYAYAKGISVIYYAPGILKPNLMLGKSGKVFSSILDLKDYLNTGEYNEPKDFE